MRPGLVTICVLVAAACVISYLLFLPPALGMADQGDFLRVMQGFGIGYAESMDYDHRYFCYVNTSYPVGPPLTAPFGSSESIFVAIAFGLHLLAGKLPTFDIRMLGFVHMLALLGAIYLLLRCARNLNAISHYVLAVLTILILCDAGYLAYLNTFYLEPATYIFGLLFIVATVSLIQKASPKPKDLILTMVPLILFAWAKSQNVPMVLVPAAFLAFSVRRYMPRTRAWGSAWIASGAMVAALLAVSMMGAGVGAAARQTNLFNSIFLQILPFSPTPAADLPELGLDPKLAAFSGQSAFTPGGAALDRTLFPRGATYGKFLKFYLSHPVRFISLTGRGMLAALSNRIIYLGSFAASAGVPCQTQNHAFILWDSLRTKLRVPWLLIPFVVLNLVVPAIFAWRSKDPRVKLLLQFQIVLLVMAGLAFYTAILGDGNEFQKHLFPFTFLFDCILVADFLWLTERFPARAALQRLQESIHAEDVSQEEALVLAGPRGVRAGAGSRFRIIAGCAALLLAINLFVFWNHWRGTDSFTFDFPMSYYAMPGYWIASIQMGEWPHWIPYQGMGYPAALNPQLGLFYPPLWIFVLLRLPYTLQAANILQALHVWWGALGFLLFARRLFRWQVALCGAVAFGLFGGFFTNAEHVDIVRGFAWIPWLLWALLLDEKPVERQAGRWRIATRIGQPNLFLPLIVACLITGAYAGMMVAAMLMAGVFILCQAVELLRRTGGRIAIVDGAVQCAQLMLGVGLVLPYLLPTAQLSGSLSRSHNYGEYQPWLLHIADLYHLLLPSKLITSNDYSMYGMQIPVLLFLFLPFARLRSGLRGAMLGIGAAACVMSLALFSPVSGLIAAVIPMFRLSRFPAGDYRIFLYLTLVTCALAGLEHMLRNWSAWRRNSVAMSLALGGLLVLCMAIFATAIPAATSAYLRLIMGIEIAGSALVIGGYVFFVKAGISRKIWVLCVSAGCLASLIPTHNIVKEYWSGPAIESYIYDGQGLPLKGPDHRLKVYGIFSRHETDRPARVEEHPQLPGSFGIPWRGYIDGTYMTQDRGGGSESVGLLAVRSDPALLELMKQPGELLQVDCTPQLCGNSNVAGVALPGRPAAGKSVQYGRNSVVYDVDVTGRSLVVENEMYAPGWSGRCELHGEALTATRVDGALRGWVIGAGHHRIRLEYRTPLLVISGIVSAVVAVFWILSVAAWFVYAKAAMSVEALPQKAVV